MSDSTEQRLIELFEISERISPGCPQYDYKLYLLVQAEIDFVKGLLTKTYEKRRLKKT